MSDFSKLPPPEELASDLMPDEPEFASDLMPDIPDDPPMPAPAAMAPPPAPAAPARDLAAEAEAERRRQHEMAELERMRAYEEAEKERALAAAAQLQAIIATCLEAAETANKAAQTATASHRALSTVSKDLSATAKKTGKGGAVLVYVGGGLLVIAASMLIAMAIQLQKKVSLADALLVKVGTTALEMKDSLEGVGKVGDGLEENATRHEKLVESQSALATKVEELGKVVAELKEESDKKSGEMKKVFDDALKTSQKPDPRLTSLLQEIKGVEARVKQQSNLLQETSKKIAGLDKQVQSMQKVGGNVERLKSQVEAMVTLEQQRYREALEAAASKKTKESSVAFPRKAPENGTPAKPGN
ncbi:MAG: hypothetical protein RLY30_1289 [Pseudomonadota bacterium]|jgi:hypothetical protein